MRVLITGAAGFIGSQLSRALADISDVVGLDDLSTGTVDNLAGVRIEFVKGSILDAGAVDAAALGCDVIVHLAARPSVPRSITDPVASHHANATGTVNVLEAARRAGGPLVIVASSSSVYGSNPVMPKHEALVPMPMSPYAASKLATEQYALAWHHSYGVPTLAFRFFNVFGPFQAAGHAYAAVVPAFVSAAIRGEPLVIHGDGMQSRDFTYVGTLCDVVKDAIVRKVSNDQPVNLAFGTRVTLLEVVSMLEVIVGRPLERRHVETRTGDVRHSQADNSRLRELFPDISPVSLETGLRAAVEWMSGQIPDAHLI